MRDRTGVSPRSPGCGRSGGSSRAMAMAMATACWLGLTPGRVRAAAGLRNDRRVVAGGTPPGPSSPARLGPMVLAGGGTDAHLLPGQYMPSCALPRQ